MPFVYCAAESLRDQPKVGSAACAALVQRYTIVGPTSEWVAGERVVCNQRICAGTAIATFRNGRYSGADHAAFFLRHGPGGAIVVIDQWRDHPDMPMRPIGIRTIERYGPEAGSDRPPERDDADAYFVIERRLTLPAPPASIERARPAAY
jgi:hypothetical protein